MDRQSFTEAAKRLEEVDAVVRKVDPLIRSHAFLLLSGYVRKPVRDVDVDELVQFVLMEAANDAEQDLRGLLDDVAAINKQKAKLRDFVEQLARESDEIGDRLRSEFGDLFDTSELDEIESRLQMAVDRRSKMLQTLSNILMKISETESGIVQNLK